MFKKTRLNCQNFDDPYLQAALILHNPQAVNEVFLLSLRDCVLALKDDHLLKKWFFASATKKALKEIKDPILLKIEQATPIILKESITKSDRAVISQLLSHLDEQPPYLDYVLLRILCYAKIGNWSRSEKIIIDFIELDPIERIKQTPWRGGGALLATKNLSLQVMEELAEHLDQKVILDSFFQMIQDFYSDPQLVEKANSLQEYSRSDLVEKLQLRYNFHQSPGFASWMLAQYLGKEKREAFVTQLLTAPELKYPWVFLGDLPDSPAIREQLAKKMALLKENHTHVFYHLVSSQEMLGVVSRVNGSLLKNIKNTKRQFYLSQWQIRPQDYWAIANLMDMGLVGEAFLKTLSEL